MKLPNLDRAEESRDKVAEYLLNPYHLDGASKAKFFMALGFERDDWQALAAALKRVATNNEVAKNIASSFGEKFIIDGMIESPSGKTPVVRTVWIIDAGADSARLVTAYPQVGE